MTPRPSVTYSVAWVSAVVNGNPWGTYSYPTPASTPAPYYFGE